MKRNFIGLVVLALAILSCSTRTPTNGAFVPSPVPTSVLAVPTDQIVEKQSVGTLWSSPKELCVQSYGLWLRKEPGVADNEIMALPQGTRLLVLSPGIWSRVYLKSYDLYGYVKSSYLGECK